MKYFTVIMLFMCFYSCSENSTIEENQSQNFEQEIKKSITTYIDVNLKKAMIETKTKVTIDNVELIKIDTLTDKDILWWKFNNKTAVMKKRTELLELKEKQIKLNASLGLYKDKTLKKFAQDEIQKLYVEGQADLSLLKDLEKQISNNPDSTTFRYFQVLTQVTGTRDDMTQGKEEIKLVLNEKYQIINFTDL